MLGVGVGDVVTGRGVGALDDATIIVNHKTKVLVNDTTFISCVLIDVPLDVGTEQEMLILGVSGRFFEKFE